MSKQERNAIAKMIQLFAFLTTLIGCGNPLLHDRPSQEDCQDYLTGQRIVLHEGTFFDTYWTIRSNEFKEFDIHSISGNSDGTKTAKVQFELNDGSKGLDVVGTIKYRVHKKEGVVQVLWFTPEQVIKLGKWE